MNTIHSSDVQSVSSASSNLNESGTGINYDECNQVHSEHDLERATLAKKESTQVFWARLIVLVVLTVTATMVAVLVYNDKKSFQQSSFEAAFLSDSQKLLDSFHQSIERIMDSGDTLSIAYTSYALSSGLKFPNVTLPHYQIHTSNARIMSEACVFNYQPIVTDETRKGWEAYVIENRMQFLEGVGTEMAMIQYQDAYFNKSEGRGLQSLGDFVDVMVNFPYFNATPENSGPYLPLWQQSPAVPLAKIVNFNVLSHPDSSLNKETMYGDKAVIFAAQIFLVKLVSTPNSFFH